jgi:hypothetical protein
VAYRDDLEAAQARADALQREVADLERRNAELEAQAHRREHPPEEPPPSPEEPPSPESTALEVRSEPGVVVVPRGATAAGWPVFLAGASMALIGGLGASLVVALGGFSVLVVGVVLMRR